MYHRGRGVPTGPSGGLAGGAAARQELVLRAPALAGLAQRGFGESGERLAFAPCAMRGCAKFGIKAQGGKGTIFMKVARTLWTV